MKISVSSYSFQAKIQTGELNQFSCIRKAKEMGFEGIEFVEIQPHDGSPPEIYAQNLREEAKKQGLTITNFTVGADFLARGEQGVKDEIQRVKKLVDLAEILGAVSMRHDATAGLPKNSGKRYSGFEGALPVLADACRKVTEYASSKGIQTMVENHGFFCQESSVVERLANAVNHENFGLLVDMGNFMCADEDPVIAVGRTAPYAFYAHAKDFHKKTGMDPDPGRGFFRTRGGNYLRGAIIGHGIVPVQQCIHILKNAGYEGFIAIEFEGLEDCELGLEIGIENLKKMM